MQNYYETLNTEEDTWQDALKEVELEDLNDFQVENLGWNTWG